jgi:4-hydroxyphenylpyruvate dioxygenase-like putative hemolysin
MILKEGDILIPKEKHSCKVKFVEGADDEVILLVDGIKDEVFYKDEFQLIDEKYKLLCKKEDRKDIIK